MGGLSRPADGEGDRRHGKDGKPEHDLSPKAEIRRD
jgi:hypothetical protein